MAEFVKQAAQLTALGPLTWLSEFCSEAQQQWLGATLPNRKVENWKYTNIRALEQGDYLNLATKAGDAAVSTESDCQKTVAICDIAGLDSVRMVFVNGELCERLSEGFDRLPAGVQLVNFAKTNSAQQDLIKRHLGSALDTTKHPFTALNASQLVDGVFLHVGKNTVCETPIQIVHLQATTDQAITIQQRLLVVLEPNSQATVVEHFPDSANVKAFTNGVTELLLAENAQLNHYRLNLEGDQTFHLGGVHARLAAGANLNSFYLALGSVLKRNDVVVYHAGSGAHCDINGLYLPRGNEQVDYHTCIEHAVPHCTSDENFRGIIADSAKAIFNGRIHIHRQAQKTLAQMSNKNLLTSNKAEIDTKPELEIYADDVQCAHGATIAQLDDTAMHYLRTRGVSAAEARVILSFGFINELVNDVKHEAIARYLRPFLAKSFVKDETLTRHIL